MRDPWHGRYILDEHGHPVPCPDLLTWGRWYEQPDNRRVALDYVGDVEVSTVFLAIDHNYDGVGPPVLWETLVSGGALDDTMRRYSSLNDAIAGHYELCERVRDTLTK